MHEQCAHQSKMRNSQKHDNLKRGRGDGPRSDPINIHNKDFSMRGSRNATRDFELRWEQVEPLLFLGGLSWRSIPSLTNVDDVVNGFDYAMYH